MDHKILCNVSDSSTHQTANHHRGNVDTRWYLDAKRDNRQKSLDHKSNDEVAYHLWDLLLRRA